MPITKEFTFGKDLVKSIRRVMGYTTDLRINLDYYATYETSQIARCIYQFIENNAAGIFGSIDMAINYCPVQQEELYSWKDKNISRLTRYVVFGQFDR